MTFKSDYCITGVVQNIHSDCSTNMTARKSPNSFIWNILFYNVDFFLSTSKQTHEDAYKTIWVLLFSAPFCSEGRRRKPAHPVTALPTGAYCEKVALKLLFSVFRYKYHLTIWFQDLFCCRCFCQWIEFGLKLVTILNSLAALYYKLHFMI